MEQLIEELREAARYCDSEFNTDDADVMRRAADTIERLETVICLADDVLMEAIGAFPLPGNPHRADCLIIRSISGGDYHERKRRAALARQAGGTE